MRKIDHTECMLACDEKVFDCESSESVPSLSGIIGQPRAVKALDFGIRIREKGFNIFVSGIPGTGRMTAVEDYINRVASTMPVPSDWCYVHNFTDPTEPTALRLPSGRGRDFKKDMDRFVANLTSALEKAFGSEDYANKRIELLKGFDAKRKEIVAAIQETSNKAGYQIQQGPNGPIFVEAQGQQTNGTALVQAPFRSLMQGEEDKDIMKKRLAQLLLSLRELDASAQTGIDKLNRKVAIFVISPLLDEIKKKFSDCDEVLSHVDLVQEDVVENVPSIVAYDQIMTQQQQMMPFKPEDPKSKYQVNLIVDNTDLNGAPVIIEYNPTHPHLFGATEKEARFGALVTNFMNIRGGSTHKANGGFLVVPVERLFMDPFAWDSLKQAILNDRVEIEEPAEKYGYIQTRSLRPMPIPFDGKVLLVGDPYVYSVLYTRDREFHDLFKVKAEFQSSMERNDENLAKYTQFICTLCKKEGLRHLDTSGLAAIVEYSSRLVSDKGKLTTRFSEIADIVREANHYATGDGAELIGRSHVLRQMEEKVYRSNMVQEKIQEMIERGTVLIDTSDSIVGQVNGLAVLSMGDFSFGKPSRITASIAVGKGGVLDIEKMSEMGGPTHTKGVQIITGYLNQMYAQERPLSLTARLVFEQSYSGVDGDSASSTELYALLSALSGVPLRQNLAVTGSVNQKGQVQAIGGVNQKIEGFFDLCKAVGLNGEQGCVIPESNLKNLMLKNEVVDAVKDGKFHIYLVSTIDEGIEVLTGTLAGIRSEDGSFQEDTIHRRITDRLESMAKVLKGSAKENDEDETTQRD